ncbi:hypothetical protein SAMN04244572_03161 [Azotobacter beijerinckii]|uniref:Virus tail fibre assembly protein, lambda gpK n=1 Tax=Azotobacter beijerinckii TaxID=170623 RepID=A0A1H6WY42_9GAMM|nr:hypothetical protein SAMN04244579_02731 [Azotobacter beijerinckii]SEJ21841.1 hypothetical protein SAMN04244572_03161 [Azotobacter beijerinckii]
MNVRNPKYNWRGGIDCEIEHPSLGWIPYTIDQDAEEGTEPHAICSAILAGEAGEITAYAAPVLSLSERTAVIHNKRLAAYRKESDQLKISAEYDALIAGSAPDYSAWQAKVEEIKERYPLPTE